MRLPREFTAIVLVACLVACKSAEIGGPSDGGATVPGAPTNVTAAAGNQSASVAWTAPASNGGQPILGYTVVISPATPSAAVVVNGTRASVTSLTNGTAYTLQVYATNAVGNGPPSAPSAPVTPTATPAAPVNLTYSDNPAVYPVNTLIAPNTPSNGGGAIAIYSVSPALPAGLSLDPVTGVITGTPTVVTAAASHQVTGSNGSGSATASLSITVTGGSGGPAVPTLVQSVSYGANAPSRSTSSAHYTFPMPNRWGAGNAVVVFLDISHGNAVSSLVDDAGNSWPTTPAVSADAGSGLLVSAAYVLPNVRGGGRTLTLDLASADRNVKVMVQEWAGIAMASPVGATASSSTAGAPTIGLASMSVAAGSLLLHYALDNTGTLGNGAPVTSMTAGSGWTLHHADLATGDNPNQNMNFFGLQSLVAQGTSVTPTLTTTGNHTVNTYCLELKSAPGAGTLPPPGIHILKMAFVTNSHITTSAYKVPWPTAGNLIVVLEDNGSLTSAPTDSNGNSWALPVAGDTAPTSALAYAKATPSQTNVITFPVTGAQQNTTYFILDVVGADPTSPYVQSVVFPVTSEGTSWTGTPVITPKRPNGIVVNWAGTGIGPILTMTSPSSAYYVSVNYTNENDGDGFDNANAASVCYYGTNLAAQSYGYTIQNATSINATAGEFAVAP